VTTTVNPEVAKADISIELVSWNSLYEYGSFIAKCPVDGCTETFTLHEQENDKVIRKQVETHIHACHEVKREDIVDLLVQLRTGQEEILRRLGDVEDRVDGIKTKPVTGGYEVVVPETKASLLRRGDIKPHEPSTRRWLSEHERECFHESCEESSAWECFGRWTVHACDKHVVEGHEEAKERPW